MLYTNYLAVHIGGGNLTKGETKTFEKIVQYMRLILHVFLPFYNKTIKLSKIAKFQVISFEK